MGTLLVVVPAACLIAVLWLVPAGREDSQTPGGGRREGSRVMLRRWWARRGRQDPRDDAALIGAALISVAARLRAGQTPERAWDDVAAGLPRHLTQPVRQLLRPRHTPSVGAGGAASPALAAALAATRLAHDLGAELSPVLESAAEGIEESARARAERETALAGPRATARLLLALPVLGLVVGTLIGARPWELLTTTIWGGLLLLTSAGLVLLGRRWIARLIARAEQAEAA